MAFTQDTFAPIGAQATEAPTAWSYRTSDTIDQVKNVGYFNLKRFSVDVGDTIWVDASDSSALLKYEGNGQTSYVVAPSAPALVFDSFSSVDQTPSALDTPLQVNFGAAATKPEVSLDANGTLTINEPGTYTLLGAFNVGRTSSLSEARVVKWLEVNGSQVGSSVITVIDNLRIAFTQQLEFTSFFPSGTEVKLFQARDSQGTNDGGLYAFTPTLALHVSPSASIRITKHS